MTLVLQVLSLLCTVGLVRRLVLQTKVEKGLAELNTDLKQVLTQKGV